MSKSRITCEIKHAGQVCAYGPSETLAVLTFEKQKGFGPETKLDDPPFHPWCITGQPYSEHLLGSVVKPAIKSLVGNFYEEGDPEADWASPMLKSLKEIEPGVWEVLIVSAYTD